jgi:hypothetical protein
MPIFATQVTTLAVSGLYLFWRAYTEARRRREHTLHERIAYLLWIVASQPS